MPRVAFAWELGGEFGHAMSCAGLARSLAARGHQIALMFRTLGQLGHHPETAAYDLFTAPRFAEEGVVQQLPVSLPEILLGCGYSSARWLEGALREWMRLFREWKPDIVVADYAPTALLAARVLGLPRTSMSISFAIPPRIAPIPPFRFDKPAPPERVAAADAQALANVNAALAAVGAAPLRALHEQFETDEDFLLSFPELDAYGNRPASSYWGPRFRDDAGISVHWPAGRGKRVLVYLKRDQPHVDIVIDLLAKSPLRVAAFIPDLEPERRKRLEGPTRIVAEKPIRYGPLIRDCDLFVSQAGSAATGTAAMGVPQLLFPQHYEQYLSARRIDMMGAGITVMPSAREADVRQAFVNILREPGYKARAQAFAKRYPSYTPAEQQRRIVKRIEDILAAPRAGGTHA